MSVAFSCCYAERHYAECHNAQCHNDQCRYAESHYAECRGAFNCIDRTPSLSISALQLIFRYFIKILATFKA